MAAGLRLLALLLLCLSRIAAAEPLPDPTLPAIDLNDTGKGGVSNVAPEEAATHGLQSIIISPGYRAAIIDGVKVGMGERTGDSKLVEVRETSVVLENARGRRVVELFPKVNIKKNEKVRQQGAAQTKASGQTDLQEQDAGGTK
jgi:hypothetical protein